MIQFPFRLPNLNTYFRACFVSVSIALIRYRSRFQQQREKRKYYQELSSVAAYLNNGATGNSKQARTLLSSYSCHTIRYAPPVHSKQTKFLCTSVLINADIILINFNGSKCAEYLSNYIIFILLFFFYILLHLLFLHIHYPSWNTARAAMFALCFSCLMQFVII